MYTIWWDHKINLASDVTRHNVTAEELANVYVSDVPDYGLAQRIGEAFREELANLGHEIFVAVSN